MAETQPPDTPPPDTPPNDRPDEAAPGKTQPEKTPRGIRARVREELTREIKRSARDQLATAGADALSLRAIARELDMASSAIYRYFASRDDLLTALIIDAYDTVGALVETAEAAVAREDHLGRWRTIGTTLRSWAKANPHEYALIYGSPVPGYVAPADTIGPATRIPAVMLGLLADVHAAGAEPTTAGGHAEPGHADGEPRLDEDLRLDADLLLDEATLAELRAIGAFVEADLPPTVVIDALRAWGEVFGLLSLELFGHFANVITDMDAFFDNALERSGRSIGAR
jgi:AcrR family transcriptional regulator